ncbi:MAG: hypothetical protein OXH52_00100 [Gammaproteobacteria bacterium]|nr:hypothetical protein [Gammaproteobacteria bacterium]
MRFPGLSRLWMGGLAAIVCSTAAVSALAALSVIDDSKIAAQSESEALAHWPDPPSLNFGAQELDNLALRSSAILAEAGLAQPTEYGSSSCPNILCDTDADCAFSCHGCEKKMIANGVVIKLCE